MSRKKFSALLGSVILVIVAVALLAPERAGKDELPESDLLLPDLAGRINDIDRIVVTTGQDGLIATLVRGDDGWTVGELNGYPAKFETVRELLAGLAQATVVEIKTANPEYHDRLGVEDVTADNAKSMLLEVGTGPDTVRVLVGRNAEGRSGRYLRMADSPQSVLSDFDARVPPRTADWAEREVADIAADEVAEVEITHPDGATVLAGKVSADDADFTLADIPEGRELQSAWSVNSLGGALTALQMDSVRPDGELDWSGATRVRLLTFSGLEVTVEGVIEGEEHWIRLHAAAPHAESGEAGDEDPAVAEAKAWNRRVAGWAFRIPAYKYESMTKRMEDMLKPLEAES